ncbi:dienelactone hydrolase family protein [Polluticoccus soli]|uniref:dienelactone hydrolase family protein n=1 Tax=Polluticoccus soli TaxID=3034150 RepID=UPI0023E143CF|nr:dienelactone hydrolase family protein [Flavipsychrobacter sp. JY13-12]
MSNEIEIPLSNVNLKGNLDLPQNFDSIIVFAHGSGSSRLSSRNIAVARFLQGVGFGTLLFDLLTEEEDRDYANRFDIPLLADRLVGVTNWLGDNESTAGKTIGYFGASTGAAAALIAAARLPGIKAVVSRGGRPDLAMPVLDRVNAPVLLIVGSLDTDVLELNRQAYEKLTRKKLEIVEGATHLFEEPGTMEEVMKLSAEWFEAYLRY